MTLLLKEQILLERNVRWKSLFIFFGFWSIYFSLLYFKYYLRQKTTKSEDVLFSLPISSLLFIPHIWNSSSVWFLQNSPKGSNEPTNYLIFIRSFTSYLSLIKDDSLFLLRLKVMPLSYYTPNISYPKWMNFFKNMGI